MPSVALSPHALSEGCFESGGWSTWITFTISPRRKSRHPARWPARRSRSRGGYYGVNRQRRDQEELQMSRYKFNGRISLWRSCWKVAMGLGISLTLSACVTGGRGGHVVGYPLAHCRAADEHPQRGLDRPVGRRVVPAGEGPAAGCGTGARTMQAALHDCARTDRRGNDARSGRFRPL